MPTMDRGKRTTSRGEDHVSFIEPFRSLKGKDYMLTAVKMVVLMFARLGVG